MLAGLVVRGERSRTAGRANQLAGPAASGGASGLAGPAARGGRSGLGEPGGRDGSLVRRPLEGPTVSDPDGAAGLRVLGAATLPPGSVPDPAGAVSVGPAVGHHVGSPARSGGAGGEGADRGRASRMGATPR